jgi:hypothetical protein
MTEQLPLRHILPFLKPFDSFSCGRVCRRWHNAVYKQHIEYFSQNELEDDSEQRKRYGSSPFGMVVYPEHSGCMLDKLKWYFVYGEMEMFQRPIDVSLEINTYASVVEAWFVKRILDHESNVNLSFFPDEPQQRMLLAQMVVRANIIPVRVRKTVRDNMVVAIRKNNNNDEWIGTQHPKEDYREELVRFQKYTPSQTVATTNGITLEPSQLSVVNIGGGVVNIGGPFTVGGVLAQH